ncbi:MAG TPA: pyridoxal-phosphate dependent enzyme [Saprospiraceae bacterium]|nr:pyridoxal-phosphate dependent enzyme [Saprospiraceae bacterium]
MSMNLLDLARTFEVAVSQEARKCSAKVTNTKLPLLDRVEYYEDIINIEVGDTSLTRARNLERELGVRQLYLKFEGGNPTGTQKDRIAFAQCHDALRRGYDTITVATCGNYGAAIALAAQLAGLRSIIYIPQTYHTLRVQEMETLGSEVRRNGETYEDAVKFSTLQAHEHAWYDANPGGQNTPLQLIAYAEIANEIYDQLRDAPKYIGVPVSNGTLIAGIYRGFVGLFRRGKTSRIPKMIAGSSADQNPIVHAFINGLKHCEDLPPEILNETPVNEPLINWHSFDGEEALYAIKKSKGAAYYLSDDELLSQSHILSEKEGLNVLPASTAGLAGLLKEHGRRELEPDRYVAIVTGRN